MSGFSAFGGSTFGNPAPAANPAQPASNIFGSANQPAQQQPAGNGFSAFGGGFGAAKPATPNAFGTSGTAGPAPGSFSSFLSQPQQGQQQQQQQQGQQQPAPSAFGGGFGSGNAFGQSSTVPTQGQQQQQPQQSAFGTGAGGFSAFGSTSTAPAAGSFLVPPQNQQQQQQGQQSQPTQSAFGGTGGLWSSSTNPAPNNFLGQQQQQQQPQQSGFGLGAFGASTSNNTASQAPLTTSVFGPSATTQPTQNNFLQQSTNTNAFAQSSAGPAASSVEAQIQDIYDAWNPQSPKCRFQHYFYNLVDPSEVYKYSRPASVPNEALWQKAVKENPNSSRLVPVLAIGFEDLKKRAQAQKTQAEAQVAGLLMLKKELLKMSESHTLRAQPRLSELSRAQVELTNRLSKLIHHLHLFLPSVRSTSIRPEEEALRAKLEAIEAELRKPGGLGRVGGRIGELWGLVGRVRAQKEAVAASGGERGGGWAVADSAAFEEIKQILFHEQQGLKYLTDVLRTALEDITAIQSGSLESIGARG